MPHLVTRTAYRLLLCSALLGAAVLPLRAQSLTSDDHRTRDVSGLVTDRHHEPLRGAIVQLQQGENPSIVTFITGDDGRYHFLRLDSNLDYRIWVKFRERTSSPRSISKFDDHMHKQIDFEIAPF